MVLSNVVNMFLFFKQLFLLLVFVRATFSIACRSYNDYLQPFANDNCFEDDDEFSNTTSLLRKYTDNYEEYDLTTDDGYIVKLFRIPPKTRKSRDVVVLLHPATTDSVVYLGQRQESLALILHELDYDVWLPNNRGTYNSLNHINLTKDDLEFWDFSFHEIGIYDYSKVLTFIKNKTMSDGLICIGHSMATTAATVYASLKPEEAKKNVKLFILMAPVVYTKNTRCGLKYIAPFQFLIKTFFAITNVGALLQYDSPDGILFRQSVYNPVKQIDLAILSNTFGKAQTQSDLINLLYSHNPRGISWKILYHYAQFLNSGGNFVMYDYGIAKNKLIYDSQEPPTYPISNITVPIQIIASKADLPATVEDADLFYNELKEEYRYGKIVLENINHIDYFYGVDRIKEIVEPILRILEDKVLSSTISFEN